METPERVIPQTMPEIGIDSSKDLFFKCPIGGFASLSPGICPKCNEQLVVVSVTDSTADEESRVGVGNHNGRSSKR